MAAFSNKIWIKAVKDEKNISFIPAFIACWWWTSRSHTTYIHTCTIWCAHRAPRTQSKYALFFYYFQIIERLIAINRCKKQNNNCFVFSRLIQIDSMKLYIFVWWFFCVNLACCWRNLLSAPSACAYRPKQNKNYSCNYIDFIAYRIVATAFHWASVTERIVFQCNCKS